MAPKSSVSAPSTGKLRSGVRWRTAKPRMQTRSQKASRPPPTPPPSTGLLAAFVIGAGVPAVWATAVLELPHDPHVFAPDLTPLKGRSGAGQYGRQHLTGHRPSGCQPVSISDPAPRRPLTDMQPPRQNIGMRGTSEFNRRGLGVTAGTNPSPAAQSRRCATLTGPTPPTPQKRSTHRSHQHRRHQPQPPTPQSNTCSDANLAHRHPAMP